MPLSLYFARPLRWLRAGYHPEAPRRGYVPLIALMPRPAMQIQDRPDAAEQPTCQRGGLLLRARLPQAVQQPGHGARVVEGGVGGGITSQQLGGLLLRARLPQAVQQAGHGARVVEGHVGGGPVGQRGGLLVRARLPWRSASQPRWPLGSHDRPQPRRT